MYPRCGPTTPRCGAAVVAVGNNVPPNASPVVDVDNDNVRVPNPPPIGIIPFRLAEQIAHAQPLPCRRTNNNTNNELADDPIDESENEELAEEVAGAPPRCRCRMNNP